MANIPANLKLSGNLKYIPPSKNHAISSYFKFSSLISKSAEIILYEDERQGPNHIFGPVMVRGLMIFIGLKVPSLLYTNNYHNSPEQF